MALELNALSLGDDSWLVSAPCLHSDIVRSDVLLEIGRHL